MNEPGPIELPNGVRFGCDCKTCNEIRDREIAADDERRKLGPLPPAPAVERHLVGLAHHPTIWEVAGPVVATLPTGERVELPAGTVLREGTLPPEPEDDRPTLGEQILADLTERAGLPREMAPRVEVPDEHGYLDGYPSTESPPANLDPTEREAPPPIPFAEAHETRAERVARLRDAMGSPAEAEPDPWLAGLTLAAYNATRAGLDRGTSAKAGVAALMSAYTAGVERAIADHAKART